MSMTRVAIMRPGCLFCGKPLRSARWDVGKFGAESDDLFCNQRCGYRWAITQLTDRTWKDKRRDFARVHQHLVAELRSKQGTYRGFRMVLK